MDEDRYLHVELRTQDVIRFYYKPASFNALHRSLTISLGELSMRDVARVIEFLAGYLME